VLIMVPLVAAHRGAWFHVSLSRFTSLSLEMLSSFSVPAYTLSFLYRLF
jgi:hypothetical protein